MAPGKFPVTPQNNRTSWYQWNWRMFFKTLLWIKPDPRIWLFWPPDSQQTLLLHVKYVLEKFYINVDFHRHSECILEGLVKFRVFSRENFSEISQPFPAFFPESGCFEWDFGMRSSTSSYRRNWALKPTSALSQKLSLRFLFCAQFAAPPGGVLSAVLQCLVLLLFTQHLGLSVGFPTGHPVSFNKEHTPTRGVFLLIPILIPSTQGRC